MRATTVVLSLGICLVMAAVQQASAQVVVGGQANNGQNPQRGFTTAVGQQGSGTAIGQQGFGTALGLQGSGTAIGQQGVGTAIIPQNNAIVIGQPEPFSSPPLAPTVIVPPITVPAAGGVPQSLTPNPAASSVTSVIGQQGITPVPTTSVRASGQNPQRGFTTAIGQQGFGTTIGQQGSGTALGLQGSGTAIGQQGIGTAIIPQNSAIVIGLPEPFSSPPLAPAVIVPPSTVPAAGGIPQGLTHNPGVPNATQTTIGQQGVGTAISPQNTAIVIGEPEPFDPPPAPAAVGNRGVMNGRMIVGVRPASTSANSALNPKPASGSKRR